MRRKNRTNRKKEKIMLGGVCCAVLMLAAGCGSVAGGSAESKHTASVGQNVTSAEQNESNAEPSVTEPHAGESAGEENAAGGNVAEKNATEKNVVLQQPDAVSRTFSFTAKDLDGNEVTESIFTEKDLTVLNIWGTFCNPCIGEMPELGEWAKDMPDNVQIVGLIIDIGGEEDTEHRDLAVDITQNAGADFRQIIANQDFAGLLRNVIGVPTTMFVDRDGNLVGDPIIGADVDAYKRFVEEYLDGQ